MKQLKKRYSSRSNPASFSSMKSTKSPEKRTIHQMYQEKGFSGTFCRSWKARPLLQSMDQSKQTICFLSLLVRSTLLNRLISFQNSKADFPSGSSLTNYQQTISSVF